MHDLGLKMRPKIRPARLKIEACQSPSRGKELGVKKVAIPSAGNAGGSLAAYAARAGIEAHVFMPKDTPAANQIEARQYGAQAHAGGRSDQRLRPIIAEKKAGEGWFDVSTLKEPYRVEGKKTMGYEIAEQLDWPCRT